MLVRTPLSALVVVLGRFLQVELQPGQLTNRVKPVPGLAECETELLVVGDRAGKVVDQELWSEGCHPRLRLGGRHERAWAPSITDEPKRHASCILHFRSSAELFGP